MILCCKQRALGVEHDQQAVGAFAVAQFSQVQAALCLGEDFALHRFLAAVAGAVGERVLDLLERGEDVAAVGLEQFALARALEVDVGFEAATIEDFLQHRG